MNLRIAMNTFTPALHSLKNMGYDVVCEEDKDSECNNWNAKKDNLLISATNPVELLGLVIIAETYGKDWHKFNMNEEDYLSYMQE